MNPLKEATGGLLMAIQVLVVIAVVMALIFGPLVLALRYDPAWGFLYFIEILWFCLPWHRRKGE